VSSGCRYHSYQFERETIPNEPLKSSIDEKSSVLTLPDFMIAGGRRCGTTSLYYWIRNHPSVFLPSERDYPYFIDDALKGIAWREVKTDGREWERKHSIGEYASRFRESIGHQAVGEKCADLFYWQPAHCRLARYVPESKFIISLRNPIDRAWSHYWHDVGKGRENLSFEDALATEEERCRQSDFAKYHFSYRRRGYYDQSMDSFWKHIESERVLVLIFEEMIKRPEEHLKRIYQFIGVSPEIGYELAGSRHHENWVMLPRRWTNWPVLRILERAYRKGLKKITGRLINKETDRFHARDRQRRIHRYAEIIFRRPAAKQTMPPDIRRMLRKIFASHIANLEGMLGRKIIGWQ
jgi:hypothetical protein